MSNVENEHSPVDGTKELPMLSFQPCIHLKVNTDFLNLHMDLKKEQM